MTFLNTYLRHVALVRLGLQKVTAELDARGLRHDLSKLTPEEFPGFEAIHASSLVHKFGSFEYAAAVRSQQPTIDQHYQRNSHHPEHGAQSCFDILEMVCDWWAAWHVYRDQRTFAEAAETVLAAKADLLSTAHIALRIRHDQAGQVHPARRSGSNLSGHATLQGRLCRSQFIQ